MARILFDIAKHYPPELLSVLTFESSGQKNEHWSKSFKHRKLLKQHRNFESFNTHANHQRLIPPSRRNKPTPEQDITQRQAIAKSKPISINNSPA
jgi:hypothetical protein